MQRPSISSSNVHAVRYGRKPGEALDWHQHHNLTLCFVIQGDYEETIRGRTFMCRSGDVVIKAPGARHLNKFGSRGAVCLLLEISEAFLKSSGFMDPSLTGPFQDHRLARIGLELQEELQLADRLTPAMLDSIATRSLVSALRLSETEAKRRRQQEAGWELLHNVEGFAEKFLTSRERQHLRRAFCEINGCSIHSYGLKQRAFRAFAELVNSDNSLSDIAAGTGFYDQAHFTKVFVKLFGMTPGRLRSRTCNQQLAGNR